MSVTKDVNLGTLIPIFIWLLGASVTAVLWAGHQSAETDAIRDWQVRQDVRIAQLEEAQNQIIRQNARIEALVGVTRDEVVKIGEILLQELRRNRDEPR